MASPKIPSCSFDDKDLDDATLVALDSTAASISGPGESPQIKRPDTQAPASDSQRSPQLPGSAETLSTVPVQSPQPEMMKSLGDGEAVQREPCTDNRPQKVARTRSSDVNETNSLSPLRSMPQVPAAMTKSSPEMYQSTGTGRSGDNLMRSTVTHAQSKENEVMRNRSSGKFRSVSLFKEYQKEAIAILDETDYMTIWGDLFIKKSGWRKLACYIGLSFEIKDKVIEFDENRDVQRAEFMVRASMPGGRFADGWGSCDRSEKRFLQPNYDIPNTAETRAKNKACQDLLGIGQYRPGISQKY